MSKKVPLYICDKKKHDYNNPCYKYYRLTKDINHAVRDDEGNPIIGAYIEDPGDNLVESYGGGEMRYCKIKGRFCVFATKSGFCSFTVCKEAME